jgi:hypothetical protein
VDEIRNPYGPGAGTPPPALVGREAELRAFAIKLERAKLGRPAKSLLATGLRGVGKTVLLNRFVEIAERSGYRNAFMEASDGGSFVRLLAVHVRTLLFELDRLGALSERVKRAMRVFRSFTGRFGLDGVLSFSIDVDPERGSGDSGDLAADLTALMVALGEAARDRRTAVLLAIDELQYLDGAELSSLIMAIHRTTQLALPIVLVGAGLPQMPALAGEARSYSERLFDFPRIGELRPEDARRAVEEPAAAQDVRFTRAALDGIVQVTHGYPYFVQEWAYHVWNHAPASPIGVEVVETVTPLILAHLDASFFRVRYERCTPTQRRYLRAMAELGGGAHRSGEIADIYGAKVTSLAPVRGQLIRQGLIFSPGHGDTAFTVPLFDEFMKRAMPRLDSV